MLWTVLGKSENIWDRVAHTKQELFANFSTSEESILKNASKGIPSSSFVRFKQRHAMISGDIACNSYYKMNEDINLLKELGVSIFIDFN